MQWLLEVYEPLKLYVKCIYSICILQICAYICIFLEEAFLLLFLRDSQKGLNSWRKIGHLSCIHFSVV